MANEIDILMDLDPLNYTAKNIDEIIAYQRKARANAEAGVKAPRAAGAKMKVDLSALGLNSPKAVAAPMKRRI